MDGKKTAPESDMKRLKGNEIERQRKSEKEKRREINGGDKKE